MKQFHMGPFGPTFIQDGSHGLWEASGMPPRPQNRQHLFYFILYHYYLSIFKIAQDAYGPSDVLVPLYAQKHCYLLHLVLLSARRHCYSLHLVLLNA